MSSPPEEGLKNLVSDEALKDLEMSERTEKYDGNCDEYHENMMVAEKRY